MRLLEFLTTIDEPKVIITEGMISQQAAAKVIAADDELFEAVAGYATWMDHFRETENGREQLPRFLEVLKRIRPFKQRLYRGEPSFEYNDWQPYPDHEDNMGFSSWSLNVDTPQKYFTDSPDHMVKYTDGPIQAVSLSDIITWRMRLRQGESYYGGEQAEYFVLEPVERKPFDDQQQQRDEIAQRNRAMMAKVQASNVSEQFTYDQTALKNYLSDPQVEIDPFYHWNDILEWLEENHPELAAKIDRDEPYQWYELPREIQADMMSDIGDELIQSQMMDNPAELDTKAHVDFRRMVKTPEWYVHFSDDANAIASKGFTQGVDDMTKLGLTTHLGDFDKKYGGYNFAFMADSRDASSAASRSNYYGDDFVMFNMRGAIEVDHYGDQETQYIVYGKELDPRNLILVEKEEGEFYVAVHPSKWRNVGIERVTNPMSYEDVIQWVAQNYDQYRKVITGW